MRLGIKKIKKAEAKCMELNVTERKYLLAVYLSLNEMGWTRLKKISTLLNVKMPSAKQFLERLKEKGLIYYEKRGGIALTNEGKKIAVNENVSFNALKNFFCNVLLLDPAQVDEAAWKVYFELSHQISNRFVDFARFTIECDTFKDLVEEFKKFLSETGEKWQVKCVLKKRS